MKARKKGSNYEWKNVAYVQLEGSDILFKEQYLEFQHDTLTTETKTDEQIADKKHWQDVRERAAIAAMQSIINSDTFRQAKVKAAMNVYESPYKEIALTAIKFADELVIQLKEE